MPDENTSQGGPERLSDDAAHRLLARAIELDQSQDSETSVAQLREAAREAGISSAAFDNALRELIATGSDRGVSERRSTAEEPTTFLGRMWRRLRSERGTGQTAVDAVVSNVIAVTLFWTFAFLLTRVAISIGWQAIDTAILIACVVGIGIARRLRARPAEIAMMGFTAFQAAELAMHLIFGIRTVQGGPTHFAVMIAGILGAAIAWIASHSKGRSSSSDVPDAVASSDRPSDTSATVEPASRPDGITRSFVLRAASPRV